MLVIGGYYSNDTTFSCDAENVWGQHNMNLAEKNRENNIWAEYLPELTTYTVPNFIRTAIGGEPTGGATATAPLSGFAAPELGEVLSRKAILTGREPTRTAACSVTGVSKDDKSNIKLGTPAIVGISVGGTVFIIALLAGCCFFIRHRQQRYQQPRLPSGSMAASSGGVVLGGPGMQSPLGWGSPVHTVPSPTSTTVAASYLPIIQPSMSPIMLPAQPMSPAELAANEWHQDRYLTPSHGTIRYDPVPQWLSSSSSTQLDQHRSPDVATGTETPSIQRTPSPGHITKGSPPPPFSSEPISHPQSRPQSFRERSGSVGTSFRSAGTRTETISPIPGAPYWATAAPLSLQLSPQTPGQERTDNTLSPTSPYIDISQDHVGTERSSPSAAHRVVAREESDQ